MLAPFVLIACDRKNERHAASVNEVNALTPAVEATAVAATDARANLAPTAGPAANGALQLSNTGKGVRITGEIAGLAPGSRHGFHVHEKGDCSAPDASSAGDHLNPGDAPHGDPDSARHHAGDLANIQANSQGVANVNFTTSALSLGDGGASDAMGKALIVHDKPDDYASQPSGNSGDRVACGVIVSSSATLGPM